MTSFPVKKIDLEARLRFEAAIEISNFNQKNKTHLVVFSYKETT